MRVKSTYLTRDERDVLVLAVPHPCGQYLNNNEIAQRLGIPINRVKMLIHGACIKLKAHNRIEAIQCALRHGQIGVNELWSLDEIVELCSTLCPDILRRITCLVRGETEHRHFSIKDEQIIHMDRRRDTILMLTKSERNVLMLAGRGRTNREIADTLSISMNAVRTFLYRVYTKLGACKRGDAVMLALKRGEISGNDLFSFNELLQYLAPLGADSLEEIAQLLNQKLGQEPIHGGGCE